jgi:hypothetical protein
MPCRAQVPDVPTDVENERFLLQLWLQNHCAFFAPVSCCLLLRVVCVLECLVVWLLWV